VGFIERFVVAALRQRLFVLLCLAGLVVAVSRLSQLPVEAFPDLTNNQVVVITEAPGMAAVEVEQRVTYPLETALMGVPGAEQVRSISKFGLSIVTIVFEDRCRCTSRGNWLRNGSARRAAACRWDSTDTRSGRDGLWRGLPVPRRR